MNATAARRTATAADLTLGAICYKGKGNTAWRVWGVGSAANGMTGRVSVVKATTATDPTRGCWCKVSDFTVAA